MKKFISMLAGVVMASSLFAASAYAAGNVTFTADKTEVKEGETVTITINSLAKTVSTDGFNVEFDTDMFECTSVAGNYYEQWHAIKQVAPPIDKMYDPVSTVAEANTQGKFGFAFAGGSDVMFQATNDVAKITFTAKKTGTTAFILNENSAGASGYVGVCDTINVTVKGDEPVTPPTPEYDFGTAGNEVEGKASKYWTVNYTADELNAGVAISLSDGDRTETIDVTVADEFDIAGDVSFYVYVVGNDIANVYIVE